MRRRVQIKRHDPLESLELDGWLTAALPITGLQVGDAIINRYSLTEKDPILPGRGNTAVPLCCMMKCLAVAGSRQLLSCQKDAPLRGGGGGLLPAKPVNMN